MAFCSKCGARISDEGQFCSSCGSPASKARESREEFLGKMKKCPSCGEKLSAFTAVCPACGHEINSSKVSNALSEFIKQVEYCEKAIAEKQEDMKTGWASWSITKKILWVIFNILFSCIPLVIYLVGPLLLINSTPKLTSAEKQLASTIENFPFPNERESILEALIFVKEKIDFIANEKVNRKSAYWTRLWGSKAEQLKQKADILFPNDKIVETSYEEILRDKASVKKRLQVKAITGIMIMIAVVVFILIRSGTFDNLKKLSIPLDIPVTELSEQMPRIENGKGEVVLNLSDTFEVEYLNITEKEFEKYKKICEENGFNIDCKNDEYSFSAYNEDGYSIEIIYYNDTMSVYVKDKIDMGKLELPNTKLVKMLPKFKSDYGYLNSASDACVILYVGNMTIDDYKAYVKTCTKKGFLQNMSQTEDSFHAENKKGNKIQLRYEGYNTVFVRIDK